MRTFYCLGPCMSINRHRVDQWEFFIVTNNMDIGYHLLVLFYRYTWGCVGLCIIDTIAVDTIFNQFDTVELIIPYIYDPPSAHLQQDNASKPGQRAQARNVQPRSSDQV